MPAISVKNLSKSFRGFQAVNNLTFDADERHVVGFLGPNGAGKTTTLRMLVGLSRASAGSIEMAGEKVEFGSSKVNRKIGYLPETPALYLWMTGVEYLEFIGSTFGISGQTLKTKITKLLKLVNLADAKDKRISTYSNGMKQRLGIAQALINDPEVILMDEPVSALDPIGRKEVLEIIEKLKKDKTVLFSTHILADVDRICDDVVIINHGKLIVQSSLADLKKQYATPILEVEFVKDPGNVETDLKKQPWVKSTEKNGTNLKVWIADEKAFSDNTVLKYFAKEKIGILSLGLKLPEIEDLFVELIGENNE